MISCRRPSSGKQQYSLYPSFARGGLAAIDGLVSVAMARNLRRTAAPKAHSIYGSTGIVNLPRRCRQPA